MSRRITPLTEELYAYCLETFVNEPDILRSLREKTATMHGAQMQISPEQGQFIRFITQVCGVEKALEIGVFTGYSSLCVATELPLDGHLTAIDIPGEHIDVAEEFWNKAGVRDKITLSLDGGIDTLETLCAAPKNHESFDFVFIDADKANYKAYYELCLKLLRKGGLIGFDNVLWHGDVADPGENEKAQKLDQLNRDLHTDERVFITLVPVGDGFLLARKL